MRVMLSTALSTCSWLAAISSGERAPLLAASTTRSLMFSSIAATSPSAPSAVEMTLLARLELSMAWLMPAISLRRPSLAIRPAGSSAPRLIRRPLERRWSVELSCFCVLAKPRWAVSDATLVLIRAMSESSVIAGWLAGPYRPGNGRDPVLGSLSKAANVTVTYGEDQTSQTPLLGLVLGLGFGRPDLPDAREVLGLDLCRGAVLAPDGVVHFLAMDGDGLGGVDPQTHLVAADVDHGDLDVVADHDRLVALTGQHQHVGSFLGKGPRTTDRSRPAIDHTDPSAGRCR